MDRPRDSKGYLLFCHCIVSIFQELFIQGIQITAWNAATTHCAKSCSKTGGQNKETEISHISKAPQHKTVK